MTIRRAFFEAFLLPTRRSQVIFYVLLAFISSQSMGQDGRSSHPGGDGYPHLKHRGFTHPEIPFEATDEFQSRLPKSAEARPPGGDQFQTPPHLLMDRVCEAWVARYNGPGNSIDWATALATDGSGDVYVTGYSTGSGTQSDYATIKYDPSGAEQWVARYNGPGNHIDQAFALAVDVSANVYVTGGSIGSDFDYATIKYDASGVEQWVARYNGPGNSHDYAKALTVDGSGYVYVTGNSAGSGTEYDCVTIKYDASGVQQWVARYNGPGNSDDWATALAVDDSGNVYITAYSWGSGTLSDYATIKYDASGVEQWVARHNGPGNNEDWPTALAVDGSGNVYVAGESYGVGTNWDYATIKYDAAGVEQWVARYDGPGNNYDSARALAVDGSGNVYVAGESYGQGIFIDYATIKYDASGVEQWVVRYNGPGNSYDWATAIAVVGSGDVFVTGGSYSSGTLSDYATIKYDASGVEQWVARHNGPGNSYDGATALAVDGSGNVYVTGHSSPGFGYDYATIKYDQSGLRPFQVVLSTPEDGAILSDVSAICQWFPSGPEVDRYWFEWGTDPLITDARISSSSADTVSVASPLEDGQTYWWRVRAHNESGWGPFSEVWSFSVLTTGVEEGEELSTAYSLSQNYPNPFNPETSISYEIPREGKVRLAVYDVLGREVATLVNETKTAGRHELRFDASSLSSGIYLYRLTTREYSQTKSMVVAK